MKPSRNLFLRSASLAVSIILCLGQAANAASDTWGADANGEWGTAGSWVGNQVPGTVGSGDAGTSTTDDATFDGAGNYTVYTAGNRGIRVTTFSNTGTTTILGGTTTTPAAASFYIFGNLTVNAGAGAVTIGDTASTARQVIIRTGTLNYTNNSSNLLTLANAIQTRGSSGTTTVTITGTGNTLASGAVGGGGGASIALTKSGNGTLTLSGANTYGGVTNVSVGALNLTGSLGNSAVSVTGTLSGEGSIGTSGSLTFNNGSFLRVNSGTAGALTVGSGSTGNLTLNATTNVILEGSMPTTAGTGTSIRLLNFNGTLTGTAANLALVNAANYRNPVFSTATAKQVNLTLDTKALTWNGTSSAAWDINTTANWNSPGENYYQGDSVTFDGTGSNLDVTLAAAVTPASLTFSGATNAQSITGAGSISSAGALSKSDASTATLAVANSFGSASLDGGTLAYAVDGTITGGLTFGATAASTNVSTLDLQTTPANLTATGLTVQTNSASANTITIGTGKTLTINGNVALGNYAPSADSTAKLTATGAGTLTANIGTGTFLIGANGSGANTVATTVDFSGLTTFNLNSTSNASILRLGFNGNTNESSSNTLTLAANSSINVGTIDLGKNSVTGATHTLNLNATGSNGIQATTLNLGTGEGPTGGGRGIGVLKFAGAGAGTLTLAGYGGVGGTNVNLATGGVNGNGDGTIDVTGHTANMTIGTLNMSNSSSTTDAVSSFKFDTGTLAITMANVGFGSVADSNATLQIGSTSASTGTATIGSLVLANNNSTGTLNILGGTLTMGGNIKEGATTPGASTLKLSGGTLDMGGFAIGTLAAPINTLTFESGILKNVASINGTAGITKTTAGTLTLEGTNSYSGVTSVQVGTLKVIPGGVINNAATSGGSGSVTGGATLDIDGGTVNFLGANALLVGDNTTAGNVIVRTGSNLNLTGAIPIGQGSSGVGNTPVSTFTQSGGTTTIGASSTLYLGNYRGATMDIQAGTLTSSSSAFIGVRGNSSLTISGASTAVTFTQIDLGLPGGSLLPTADVNLNGGTLTLGANGITKALTDGAKTVSFDGGTLKASAASPDFVNADSVFVKTGGATIDTNTFDVTIDNALLQFEATTGSLTKSGAGTLTLSNTNTYTGPTAVNEGTLHLTGTLAAGSAVTVGGNGTTGTPTLTGAGGTVNGTLTMAAAGTGVAGRISPGTVGTLNAGATTLAGTYACDVSGINTDLLAVTGDLVLTGSTLAITGTANPGTYVIATYTGTRTGSLGGTLPSGYTVNYDDANKEVELMVAATGSDYDTWGGPYGLASGSEGDDLDKDGLTNFAEYAFGLVPNSGSSVNPISSPLSKSTGLFKYTRRNPTVFTTGVTYTCEYSTTLSGAWTPFTPDSTATNNGNPTEEITIGVPSSLLTNLKLFIHVKANK